MGCEGLNSFPQNKGYRFSDDPLAEFYQKELVSIEGKAFDSNQVSNKHLDPKMVVAIEKLNQILANPSKLPKNAQLALKKANLKKVTLASASRSPLHQFRIGGQYKASPFASNHLLGMAVDLEMKGKPFDIKRRAHEEDVKKAYEALKLAMNQAGLFFSEPVHKDPNHIELLAWSRKSHHSSFDFKSWKSNALKFMISMKRRMATIEKSLPRGPQKRFHQRQLLDLEKRIDEITSQKDPTHLGPWPKK